VKLEVWKFGGASLADGRAIAAAAERIAAHRGPLVVVASALAGVTDLLLQSTPAAADTFARKHQHAARQLLGLGKPLRELSDAIDQAAREYRDICAAIDAIGHLGLRGQDALVARGERVSAQLLTAAGASMLWMTYSVSLGPRWGPRWWSRPPRWSTTGTAS